jgi:hypothetical protein
METLVEFVNIPQRKTLMSEPKSIDVSVSFSALNESVRTDSAGASGNAVYINYSCRTVSHSELSRPT